MEHEIRSLLGHRWADILHARYYEGKTLSEVASEEGCSRQRIHTIEKKALRRLKSDPIIARVIEA